MEFNFADSFDSIDPIPEQFRSLYAKAPNGSNFVLQKDNPMVTGAVEAIVGLNSTLKKVRADLDTAKKNKVDLSPLSEWGTDPTAISAAITAKVKELQDQAASGTRQKVDLDAVRADMSKQFGTKETAYQAQIKSLQEQMNVLLVDNGINAQIAAMKCDELIFPFAKAYVRTINENGVLKMQVVDDQGNPRFGQGGQEMTIAELFQDMKSKAKFAKLFPSESKTGGGATPNGASKRSPATGGKEMTATQKIAAGLKTGNRNFGGGS